jgi:hypothetical protein
MGVVAAAGHPLFALLGEHSEAVDGGGVAFERAAGRVCVKGVVLLGSSRSHTLMTPRLEPENRWPSSQLTATAET